MTEFVTDAFAQRLLDQYAEETNSKDPVRVLVGRGGPLILEFIRWHSAVAEAKTDTSDGMDAFLSLMLTMIVNTLNSITVGPDGEGTDAELRRSALDYIIGTLYTKSIEHIETGGASGVDTKRIYQRLDS